MIHKIEVLGSGCSGCRKLYDLTVAAVKELGRVEEVSYETDVARIIEMGVMSTPVLAVDGKPILSGFVPDQQQVKEALEQALA